VTKRYHVQVLVREGSEKVWRRVRPTNGDPYVFSEEDALAYMESHILTSGFPDRYRLEELPDPEQKQRWNFKSLFSDLMQ